MIEIDRNPAARTLRWFAGLWYPLFCALLGLLLHHRFGVPLGVSRALWASAAVFGIAGLLHPPTVRWLYLGLTYATYPIGWIVSHVVLAILFYLVMTPVGLLLRALGRDPLVKGPRPDQQSYWRRREPPSTLERYFRQY